MYIMFAKTIVRHQLTLYQLSTQRPKLTQTSEGDCLQQQLRQEPQTHLLKGRIWQIYTVINDKLVGLLLRTRKHQLTYFEGEVLFQKRDDDVPVFLMQPIDDIRTYCNNRALQARRSVSPMPERF